MGKNKETMKRVLKFISPYKAKIIIMLLTALVTVGFTLYTNMENFSQPTVSSRI